MNQYDTVIIGAGIAGLTAAKELASNNLKPLVVEKNLLPTDKICGGGLTTKSLHLVPPEMIEIEFKEVQFVTPKHNIPISLGHNSLCIIDRFELNRHLIDEAKDSGVDVLTDAKINQLDIGVNTITIENESYHYNCLIGADGSNSNVRKHLGIPTQNKLMTVQYKSPTLHDDLEFHLDLDNFGHGYGWIFPHTKYTSVGCGGSYPLLNTKNLVPYLNRICEMTSLETSKVNAFPINYDYRGFKFGNKYLVGDAGGFSYGISGEGIYQSFISGSEIAKIISNPNYQYPILRKMLKTKKRYDSLLHNLYKVKYSSKFISDVLIPTLYKSSTAGRLLDKTMRSI